ncbi:MAG: aldo/keto reductase, partial [Proteobacteria bacterium]|nr:aldo/keto reductase [Pseudomonadota bacterium]
THQRTAQAREVIQAALKQGITYFDSARVYDDSEIYYGSVWQEIPETRLQIFQASKSASRDRAGALADLQKTFERLKTNYIDLWQIHDIRTNDDIEMISRPGGALEAFIEAKASGNVRFLGVTGHHDPAILTRAVEAWPVDAVMMPVNPVEGILGGFLTTTLPAAKAKGIAIIGMKILGASHYVHLRFGITPELLIRYALSQDITVAIVGCSSAEEVKTLAETGRDFKPLATEETSQLLKVFEPYARRLAYYRGVL